MRDLRAVVLGPMATAGIVIALLSGTGNLAQTVLAEPEDPLGLAALGWYLVAVGCVVVRQHVRAGLERRAAQIFMTLAVFVTFGVSMVESAFGSLLLLTLGPAYVTLTAVGLLPPEVHARWRWGTSVGAAVGLGVRHLLRPLPLMGDALEGGASVLAVGVAVFAVALLGEKLIDDAASARDASQRALADLERNHMALVISRDRALAASRAKAAFLANMSHELRTPLNAILGYVELMQEESDELPSRVQSDLDNVSVAAHHLLSTISEILDLSRIEAGQIDLVLEPVDTGEVADTVRRVVQPMAARGNNTLVLEVESHRLRTDGARLRQILVNLLGNATKFTRDGTITLRGAPEVRAQRTGIRFEVEDTGVGIESDRLTSIFEPFNTSAGSEQGSGVGLTVSRAFAEHLGGSLAVRSEPGKGSVFTLWLPHRTDDTTPGALARQRSRTSDVLSAASDRVG